MVTYATKSLDDVVTEARQIINDTVTPYRWSNDWLISNFNTALRELYRYRPDAFIGNFTQGALTNNPIPTYDAETDLAQDPPTPLPVDDRLFFDALMLFVTGRTELSDDEFADDNRAMTLTTAFRNMLIGPGG